MKPNHVKITILNPRFSNKILSAFLLLNIRNEKLTILFLILMTNAINCNAQEKKRASNKTMIIPNRTIKNIVIPDIEQMNIQSQKEDSIQLRDSWGQNRKIKRVIKNTVNDSTYSLEENDSEGLIRKLTIENSNLLTFDEVFKDKRNVIIINKEWTDYKDKPVYLTIDYHYAFYETGNLKKSVILVLSR